MTITTKCGNKYSEQEWNEMMEQWDAAIAEASDYTDGMYKIIRKAAEMLEPVIGKEKAYAVASRMWEYGTEGISFTDTEKRKAVEEIDSWMRAQERKIR